MMLALAQESTKVASVCVESKKVEANLQQGFVDLGLDGH